VRGKGDVAREIPIPAATFAALEACLRTHPQRVGGGLRDDDVLFVSLARAIDSSQATRAFKFRATVNGVRRCSARPRCVSRGRGRSAAARRRGCGRRPAMRSTS
jgi:hypothetical protein